jgi:hypothetical protein
VEINSNIKIPRSLRERIGQLYFAKAMSNTEIRQLLKEQYDILASKFAVLYALDKTKNPIPQSFLDQSGSRRIIMKHRLIDLLPLVSASDLRWADDEKIILRFENSERVIVKRLVDFPAFGRLLGLYAAEGSKGNYGSATFGKCNAHIIEEYSSLLKQVLSAKLHKYEITGTGNRQPIFMIRVGGVCARRLLMNSIEATMNFLANSGNPSELASELGLKFLSGYAEGDGSISLRHQTKNPNAALFYITEGDESQARKLCLIYKRLFGKGYLYHPARRNYYLVCLSLTPDDALTLLRHGFFVHYDEMRKRLVSKAMESKRTIRLIALHKAFGDNSFTLHDIERLGLNVSYTTLHRAVRQGILKVTGAQPAREEHVKWYRLYGFTNFGLDLIDPILSFYSCGN